MVCLWKSHNLDKRVKKFERKIFKRFFFFFFLKYFSRITVFMLFLFVCLYYSILPPNVQCYWKHQHLVQQDQSFYQNLPKPFKVPLYHPCNEFMIVLWSDQYDLWPRAYKTRVHSQTQNKAQWLAVCGHMSASNQSLGFILSLRLYSRFITSRPGESHNAWCHYYCSGFYPL